MAARKKQVSSKAPMISAAGVALAAGAAWYFRNELLAFFGIGQDTMAPHVRAQVPVAKNLKTIPDQDANYDIDGVSFDSEGVIVGSDNQFESPTEKQVQH